MSSILALMLYLLTPTRPHEWAWKLLVLCLSTSFLAIGVRLLADMPPGISVLAYIVIVSVIAAPPFLLGMFIARQLLRLQNELQRLATTDLLTGLANRRAFLGMIEGERNGAVLMIDVDHFKSVNDMHGHGTGDEVLRKVAMHLLASVRQEDLVGRFGGEEFAVYLRDASDDDLLSIGKRICQGFEVTAVPQPLSITLSVGIARARDGTAIGHLLHRADQALYSAKRAGRARAVFWSEELSAA